MHDLLPSFSFNLFFSSYLGSPIEASPQASLVRIAQEWSRVTSRRRKCRTIDMEEVLIGAVKIGRRKKENRLGICDRDLVDVQDHKDTWYEAEIKDVDCDDRGNIDRVLVHFFWDKFM